MMSDWVPIPALISKIEHEPKRGTMDQIHLPESVMLVVERYAEAEGKTTAEVLCEAVDVFVEHLRPDGPLHVRVSRALYDRREMFDDRPVTVQLTDPGPDGFIDIMFTTHSRLWLVTGPRAQFVVRARDEHQARGIALGDETDVDGNARECVPWKGGDALDDLCVREITPQGATGVIAEERI